MNTISFGKLRLQAGIRIESTQDTLLANKLDPSTATSFSGICSKKLQFCRERPGESWGVLLSLDSKRCQKKSDVRLALLRNPSENHEMLRVLAQMETLEPVLLLQLLPPRSQRTAAGLAEKTNRAGSQFPQRSLRKFPAHSAVQSFFPPIAGEPSRSLTPPPFAPKM